MQDGVVAPKESKVRLEAVAKENNQNVQKEEENREAHSKQRTLKSPRTCCGQTLHNLKTIAKLTIIVCFWAFFTIIFFMYKEKETIFMGCVLKPKETKEYALNISSKHLKLRVDLAGPLLSYLEENELNSTEQASRSKVKVWLDKTGGNADATKAESVSFYLRVSTELAFSEAEPRWGRIEHRSESGYVIKMHSDASEAIPMSISYHVDPISTTTGLIYSSLLLGLLYVLIIFEIINRTLAAIVVSTMSLAVLCLAGERPSLEELVSWLDVETLLLLVSMMLLVAIMSETGMFDFIAVYTFQVTKGKMWPLINLLCIITAVFSTVLDNVTTVLLITPVTIKLCEVMNLHPIPVLMAMVIFSNIGGTATPVGDPPNVIIASNQIVTRSGINFANFTLHMTFGVLLVSVQTYFQLRYMYRDVTKLRLSEQQISDLKAKKDKENKMNATETANKEESPTTSDQVSRSGIQEKGSPDDFQKTLSGLKQKYKVRDKNLLIKSCVAVTFVVIMFFLHALPEFSISSLGWTALLGAILLLILADREDLESILHKVEWSTLLFFAALFVLMEVVYSCPSTSLNELACYGTRSICALTKLGLIDFIGGHTETFIMAMDKSHRLAVALLLILWVSGVTSAFVDNIPLTTMMIRVVTSLGMNPSLGLPLQPLVWALSFGACLGGNGTLIGASANVVCAGVAEQHGYKITFVQFFKVGFPLMMGHLIVASVYLLVCHCLFHWH